MSERLEEIKDGVVALKNAIKDPDFEITEMHWDPLIDDFEHLIEQAEQNKRYREAEEKVKMIIGKEYDDILYTKKEALRDISKTLDSDCIHCNGKGFNGLDYCSQCNQLEGESE